MQLQFCVQHGAVMVAQNILLAVSDYLLRYETVNLSPII